MRSHWAEYLDNFGITLSRYYLDTWPNANARRRIVTRVVTRVVTNRCEVVDNSDSSIANICFLDAPRISIRGFVRPSVGPSVGPSVRIAFVKIAENGVMQDEGASRAVYPALFIVELVYDAAGKHLSRECFL